MKGGIFNRPECCNNPCECPICFEVKTLKRLNCDHYICQTDINHILALPRRNQTCPICRKPITSYGCNGIITNVGIMANYQQPNIFNSDEDTEIDTDLDEPFNPNMNIHGGKKKHKRRRRKTNKKSKKHGKRRRTRKH